MLGLMLVHAGLLGPSFLDHVGACWAYVGPCWALGMPEKFPTKKTFRWEFFGQFWAVWGPMFDLCWAYVGSCWALGGHVGAILSLCWAKNGVFI